MDIDRVPEEMVALCLRAQRLIAETAEVRRQLAVTRQETRALIDRAQQIHLDDVWPERQSTETMLPPTQIDLPPPLEAHDAQLLALRVMRDILNDFPLSVQATLLKVLTARTMVLIHDQLYTPTVLSA